MPQASVSKISEQNGIVAIDWAAFFHSVQQISFALSRSGPTSSRPTSDLDGRWIGEPFFDTTLGQMVFLQSVNPDVWVTWGAATAGWTMVSKASDQSKTNDSTLADDSVLFFALSANTVYRVRGMVFFNTDPTPDFQYRFHAGGTSLALRARILHWYIPPNSATPTFANNTNVDVQTSVLSTGGAGGCVQFEAVIDNSTATIFSFQWAQDTSNLAATTVKAGSYMEYMVAV